MANKTYGLAVLIAACVITALIVGFAVAAMIPEKIKVETKEVVKEVPVEKIVEVTKEVTLNVKDTFLTPAIKDFIKEASDSDDFVFCSGEEFDEDQIKVKSDPRDWKVQIGKDETSVSFDVKMKYLDKDVQEKCYSEYEVEVIYEDDEDPQVEFSLI